MNIIWVLVCLLRDKVIGLYVVNIKNSYNYVLVELLLVYLY